MASLSEYAAVPGLVLVECPYCHAGPGKRCQPPNGFPNSRNIKPHAARIKAAQQKAGENE